MYLECMNERNSDAVSLAYGETGLCHLIRNE